MLDTMIRYLAGVHDRMTAYNLKQILQPCIDSLSSGPLTNPALVISAGGATTAKIGAADFYAIANGVLVKVAAATVLPALTGINAGAGAFNVALFFVSSAGTVTVLGGTAGATIGAIKFPVPTKNCALIGTLLITYASAFTGGTTALDTATTVYISATDGYDASALTG